MVSLSVILPCYNVKKYIANCLNSILANSLVDVEILIIDDGSQDGLGKVLNAYFGIHSCEKDCTFIFNRACFKIIHQNNKGVSAARNTGIENAQGDYIVFIDPDDIVKADYFSSIRKTLDTNVLIDVLIMGFEQIYEDSKGKILYQAERMPINFYSTTCIEETIKDVLPFYCGYSIDVIRNYANGRVKSNQVLEWGGVWRNDYRREFLVENSIKFNTSIFLNEDGMFNTRCFSFAQRVYTLMHSYYRYVVRPTGAMSVKRDIELLNNKLALLEERENIITNLRMRGFEVSPCIYAGSCVMSALELISKMPLSLSRQTLKYTRSHIVQDFCEKIGHTNNIKINIGIFVLKYKIEIPAIFVFNVLKKLGMKI